jgi:hypothetical protein
MMKTPFLKGNDLQVGISRLTSRNDPNIQRFVSRARDLGEETCNRLFDRCLFCDLFNGLDFPENQIFLLRPAKFRELKRIDFQIRNNPGATILNELKFVAMTSYPELVANFRLFPKQGKPSEAFLINIYGEKSCLKSFEYFRPKSSVTFKARCLSLGGYVWSGSKSVLKPFYSFCFDGN